MSKPPNVWFTADTHFDHAKIADIRGFDSAVEHDEEVIRRWNAVVKPGDIVWHLGDVGMGRLERFAPQVTALNGQLHLVLGNHDEPSPVHRKAEKKQRQWLELFESVQTFARRRIGGTNVLLSHYPYAGDHTDEDRYRQYRFADLGEWLLHGHTHSERAYGGGKQVHVGMDAWAMFPVPLSVIASDINFADSLPE